MAQHNNGASMDFFLPKLETALKAREAIRRPHSDIDSMNREDSRAFARWKSRVDKIDRIIEHLRQAKGNAPV